MAHLYVHYGNDAGEMTTHLLREAGVAALLRPDMRVCIKPNLVVSRPASEGATTHPEIVEGILRFLQELGVREITIAEGAWVGDSTRRAFDVCGYSALGKRYGVSLLDTKSDQLVTEKAHGLELKICRSVAEADFLINVPVLKGHCQTDMTCCLKNLKGCIPDSEKRRYHTLGLHGPIAALNTVLKPQLHVVDGLCGDPTFEEGGNPVASNRILLGFDPVLLDSYCAELLGYRAAEIGYLALAEAYGVGQAFDTDTTVHEYGVRPPATVTPRSGIARQYARYIHEDGACSACYAALVCALHKGGAAGRIDKIGIGQGFRGKVWDGIGVGNCTAGCRQFAAGCPPTALDILTFLQGI